MYRHQKENWNTCVCECVPMCARMYVCVRACMCLCVWVCVCAYVRDRCGPSYVSVNHESNKLKWNLVISACASFRVLHIWGLRETFLLGIWTNTLTFASVNAVYTHLPSLRHPVFYTFQTHLPSLRHPMFYTCALPLRRMYLSIDVPPVNDNTPYYSLFCVRWYVYILYFITHNCSMYAGPVSSQECAL